MEVLRLKLHTLVRTLSTVRSGNVVCLQITFDNFVITRCAAMAEGPPDAHVSID